MHIVSRIAAAVISLAAGLGLAGQWFVSYRENTSVLLTLWIVLAFFTITTNVLVGVVFAGIAAGTMLSIFVSGCCVRSAAAWDGGAFGWLRGGECFVARGDACADAAFLDILCAEGVLSWRHPVFWAIYPVMYLLYGLVRGAATGKYAYPFPNLAMLGWKGTMLNVVAIAATFLLAAYAVVWIDGRIDSREQAKLL